MHVRFRMMKRHSRQESRRNDANTLFCVSCSSQAGSHKLQSRPQRLHFGVAGGDLPRQRPADGRRAAGAVYPPVHHGGGRGCGDACLAGQRADVEGAGLFSARRRPDPSLRAPRRYGRTYYPDQWCAAGRRLVRISTRQQFSGRTAHRGSIGQPRCAAHGPRRPTHPSQSAGHCCPAAGASG